MAPEVFISYSSKDSALAEEICRHLEGEGIACWMAPRNILPGHDWSESIMEGIRQARVALLVLSHAANESPQIKREIEQASRLGLPIVPFRVQNTPVSKALQYFISTSHWLNAFEMPPQSYYGYLAQILKNILSGDRQAQADIPETSEYKNFQRIKNRKRSAPYAGILIGFFVLMAVILAVGFFIYKNVIAKPEKPVDSMQVSLDDDAVSPQGTRGIVLHLAFRIVDSENKNCRAIATFFDSQNLPLRTGDKRYSSPEGTVATWVEFVPGSKDVTYENFPMFLPYEALIKNSGGQTFSYCLRIFRENRPLTDCVSKQFTLPAGTSSLIPR